MNDDLNLVQYMYMIAISCVPTPFNIMNEMNKPMNAGLSTSLPPIMSQNRTPFIIASLLNENHLPLVPSLDIVFAHD